MLHRFLVRRFPVTMSSLTVALKFDLSMFWTLVGRRQIHCVVMLTGRTLSSDGRRGCWKRRVPISRSFTGCQLARSTISRLQLLRWGIAGWADPSTIIRNYEDIDRERDERVATGSCWAFSGDDDLQSDVGKLNDQVLKIINVLGNHGAGRRAVLKAVASRQGIVSEDELDLLYSGKSKLKAVPRSLRKALQDVGLGDVLPVNILTSADPLEVLVAADDWQDLEFEVALDSGSVVHVCAPGDIPGYLVQASAGSRRGQEFLMGDGGTIPNLGESQLNLSDQDKNLQSVFQIAAVTRPLMSVGRICDQGHSITFNAVMAVVHSAEGTELCKFERQPGGLYVAKLKLRSPAGFGGLE